MSGKDTEITFQTLPILITIQILSKGKYYNITKNQLKLQLIRFALKLPGINCNINYHR